MNSTIQIRIDEKTKVKANRILKNMGLDMSSGIKLFLNQIVNSGEMPFQVRTVNGYTPEFEERMVKETEYALKYGKSFNSAKEMHDYILKH